MTKLERWWAEYSDKLMDTIEYKVESFAFNISIQVFNRMKELNISQVDLAKRMNVTKSYISQILKGNKNMTIETIVKLSEILDMQAEISLNFVSDSLIDELVEYESEANDIIEADTPVISPIFAMASANEIPHKTIKTKTDISLGNILCGKQMAYAEAI